MITLRRLAASQYKGLQAIDLSLPERGSFLIEGRNEAGKSTLFDAVFFALYGSPLIGDIPSAIHYGAEETEVRLALDVSGTSMTIRRRARQTAKTLRTEAELEVRRGDDAELVKGAAAVTQRVKLELGGLTDDALLNSCLVAQKQLGRLETLGRSEREQALTVLLNLDKLSAVENRLRVRREDEAALQAARVRVNLAKATRELATLDERRAALRRTLRLLDLRDSIAHLQALQEEIQAHQGAVHAHEVRLADARRTLEHAARLATATTAWQRVVAALQGVSAAEDGLGTAQAALSDAQDATACLPRAQSAAAAAREAREQATTLSALLGRRRETGARLGAIASRLTERERLAQHAARLEGELDELRRQRRDLASQVSQLAPVEGARQEVQAQMLGLQSLQRRLEEVTALRRHLEDVEASATARAEADARYESAAADLAEARVALAGQTQLREQHANRRLLEQRRDLLATWLERRAALDAAEQARRLMDDLALAVSGVEHVVLRERSTANVSGLRLGLVLDHPLTGAQYVQLQVTASGAAVTESRPATPEEAGDLQAGGLPTLNAGGDARERAQLAETAQLLRAAGEATPRSFEAGMARLDQIAHDLTAPAPDFDEEAYVEAAGAASAAQGRLKEAEGGRRELAPAAQLARESSDARQALAAAERECATLARRLLLPTADPAGLPEAIRLATSEAQERSDALAAQHGQRQGLQGQLDTLDRTGRDRKRELEVCLTSLQADDPAALEAEQRSLQEVQAAAGAEALRLYAGLRAALGGKDSTLPRSLRASDDLTDQIATTLQADAQRLADETGRALALLEQRAAALDGATAAVTNAEALIRRSRASLTGVTDAAQVQSAVAIQNLPGAAPALAKPDGEVTTASVETHLAALATAHQRLDEPAAREAEQDAQRAAGAAGASLDRALADAARAALQATALAESLGHGVTQPSGTDGAAEPPATLASRLLEACPELGEPLPARDETSTALAALDEEAGGWRQARADAVATLGKEEALDVEAAEAAFSQLKHDLDARRVAVDMVSRTRRRMIDKVLPETIRNMNLLLPQLTAGRYRYADFKEDYRLRVWDDRKHDYVEKHLYSGGTQDQFSLALRLGFALAALPRELGTSPGFLFLDEPLSSFDRDRTAALVDLLTHGQIATFFQQVFLISHSQSFDPGLFSHHITMEDGRVALSTLPAAPAA